MPMGPEALHCSVLGRRRRRRKLKSNPKPTSNLNSQKKQTHTQKQIMVKNEMERATTKVKQHKSAIKNLVRGQLKRNYTLYILAHVGEMAFELVPLFLECMRGLKLNLRGLNCRLPHPSGTF